MEKQMTLRSGAVIKAITKKEADSRNYLSRQTLSELHLMPQGEPVAFEISEGGNVVYYFHPERVVEAPVELWYSPSSRKECIIRSRQALGNSYS